MCHVVSSGASSAYLAHLRRWLLEEWGEVEEFATEKDGIALPVPLLALRDEELVGGLVFSSFRRPRTTEIALWVNAVFVAPAFRRRGIASKLIEAAEPEAIRHGHRRLFALSDLPDLYEKLDWHLIETCPDGKVMGREFG